MSFSQGYCCSKIWITVKLVLVASHQLLQISNLQIFSLSHDKNKVTIKIKQIFFLLPCYKMVMMIDQ